MRTMHKSLWAACAAAVLWSAGCSQPAAQSAVPSSASNALSPACAGRADMPSYPILLTDLPRYEAGQPVPPVRPRVISLADHGMDMPSPPLTRAVEPAWRYTPPPPASASHIASGTAAPPAGAGAHKPLEPIDVQYVP